MTPLLDIFLMVSLSLIYASIIEWLIHRYMMHRPLGKFYYPFRTHTLTHHRIFKADQTYHLSKQEDKATIPMAWWNGPLLILIAAIPSILPSLLFHTWLISLITLIILSIYYGVYEYLHWCMHLPRRRPVERFGIFFRINGHHLLHHRYMYKNFNVVLPVADLLFGTLLTRSKISFQQARGESVPDVQPK